MIKNVMVYSLLLFLLTACSATETTENKVTLAEMTKEKAEESVQVSKLDSAQQTMPVDSKDKEIKDKENNEEKKNEEVKDKQAARKVTVETKDEESGAVNDEQNKQTEIKADTVSSTGTTDQKKEQKQNPAPKVSKNQNLKNYITWDDFFDNGDQSTPSQKFWDLKGQHVTIDGFMGEVLSLDGGWFLLIPTPGAECPFDNGDETYWNKIMIVFVKHKKDLRFTGGPLRLEGRLDVGVKVDESNYKTMFRLYDATLEELN